MSLRFDPSLLISGPFKTCPNSGSQEFGILGVGHEMYMRCRACWSVRIVVRRSGDERLGLRAGVVAANRLLPLAVLGAGWGLVSHHRSVRPVD